MVTVLRMQLQNYCLKLKPSEGDFGYSNVLHSFSEPVDLYANASQFGKEGEDGLIKCSGTGGNLTIYQGSTTFTGKRYSAACTSNNSRAIVFLPLEQI